MKEGKELSSLRRIFLLLVVILTISLIGAFVYINDDTRQDRIRDLAYTSSVIKEYYELSFHQWELSLRSVGLRIAEIETLEEQSNYAAEALKLYERELLAFGFALPDGQVTMFKGVTMSDSLPNLMSSNQTRRSFELARVREHITLGECYYFKNVEDWILPIRVPIFDDQKNLIAVNTSAIDYSSTIADLEGFGFNSDYRIHLISQDFGTTQILFPLDSAQYQHVLGNDTLTYNISELEQYDQDIDLIKAIEPLNGHNVIGMITDIDPVNHSLVISMPDSLLTAEIFDRLKVFIFAYFVLLAGSALLYLFVRQNMKKSLFGMQTERANLKSIIESTEDYIGFFDRENNLVEYNKAFAISAKVTDDVDVYKGIDLLNQLKAKEQVKMFREDFAQAALGAKFSRTVHYPGPDGEIIFQFNYNPIHRNDEVVGISLFAKDITEVKRAQLKLEEYNKNLEKEVSERTTELEIKNAELINGYDKLKSTQEQLIRAEKMASLGVLAAGIGHEINNPLNFIKHGAEGLEIDLKKMPDYDADRMDGYFNAIYEGVKRAADIVSGLSHFNRGGSSLDEDCNLIEIMINSLNIAATRFKSKSIEVVKNFECEAPIIKGNDGKLHQLFTNIIVNAEQAIETRGTITLSIIEDREWIHVLIQDSGSGMSPETLNKLTDPFFTTKDPGEGTGLGLFISQIIVEEHKGKLEIDSEVGKGSTFSISFPHPKNEQKV